MTTPRSGMRGSFARSSSRAAPSPSPTRSAHPLQLNLFSSPARSAWPEPSPPHTPSSASMGGGGFSGVPPPTPNGAQSRRERINVFVRPRPLQANAAADSDASGAEHMQLELRGGPDGPDVKLFNPAGVELRHIACDGSFAPHVSQAQVYEKVGRRFVDALVHKAINGTIFCYGQTGSGKTWTTFGSDTNHVNRGLIPRLLDDVFAELEQSEAASGGKRTFTVTVEFLEIHNEAIKDLLAARSPTNAASQSGAPRGLDIATTIDKKVYVQGLSKLVVDDSDEAMRLLHQGQKARTTAATTMNETSSRSHSVFTLTVESKESCPNSGETTRRVAKLNLVDLAGSESQKSVATEGLVRKEGNKINQSLSTLSHVIQELAEGKAVPSFRNSKLTHLLRDSLGGNSLTTLVATINTSVKHQQHTLSTLQFAERAQVVRFDVRSNVGSQHMDPAVMRKRLEEMTREIQRLRNQVAAGAGSGAGAGAAAGFAGIASCNSLTAAGHVTIDAHEAALMIERNVSFIGSYERALEAKELQLQEAQSICTELAEMVDAYQSAMRNQSSSLPSGAQGQGYSATMPSPAAAAVTSATLAKLASDMYLQGEDASTAAHMEEVHKLRTDKKEMRLKNVALEQQVASLQAEVAEWKLKADADHNLRLVDEQNELIKHQDNLLSLRDGELAARDADLAVVRAELEKCQSDLQAQVLERLADAHESDAMLKQLADEAEQAETRASQLSSQVAKLEAQLAVQAQQQTHRSKNGRGSMTPLQLQAQPSALLSSPLSPIQGNVRPTRLSALFDNEKAGRRSLALQSPMQAAAASSSDMFHSPTQSRGPAMAASVVGIDENEPHTPPPSKASTRHFSMSPEFYAPEPHGPQMQSPRPLQALQLSAGAHQGRLSFHMR